MAVTVGVDLGHLAEVVLVRSPYYQGALLSSPPWKEITTHNLTLQK